MYLLCRYGVQLTYYGISLNISGFGLNLYLTQFIFASIEMPTKIGVYFFVEKVGRRSGEMGALLLTGVCLFINLFVPKGYFCCCYCYLIQYFNLNTFFGPSNLIYIFCQHTCKFLLKCQNHFPQISGLFVLLWQSLEKPSPKPHVQSFSSTQLNSTLQLYG